MFLRAFAISILGLFALFFAIGAIGSSFDMSMRYSPGVAVGDSRVPLGTARAVRSDEWVLLTPLAVAQTYHQPQLAIINKNMGVDGHNMLPVGMSGVPVAHASALAKPATWGYFVFDLKRALAWAWWMPVFGCLFALWGVMSLLLPGRPILGLATSLSFIFSSYVVAWSNWPAYAVFFPAAGLWLAHRGLITPRWWLALVSGVLLGLCLAGFVLILYPPWQVSVGYLFVALAAGLVWHDRLWLRFDMTRGLALVLAALVAGAILYAWWLDAAPAVHAIQSTIYPGQRVATSGGGVPLWQFVEGFLNHYTLYFDGAPGTNASESSSFFYFFPVAIVALAVAAVRKEAIGPLEAMLSLFCLWVVWYQLVGIPPVIAKLTLWGRVPDYRADLSLGLASIMLCALVVTRARPAIKAWSASGLIPALVWASFVAWAASLTPPPTGGDYPAYLVPCVFVFTFVMSWLLWVGRARAFFALLLVATLTASLPFNPLSIAPNKVEALGAAARTEAGEDDRVLVVGSQIQAMALVSAGVPVVNGVFYYPPKSLWASLDPEGKYVALTNRFQHLIFVPEAYAGADTYHVESPQDDVVIVKFDPDRFDFTLTKAGRVIAPNSYDLSGNPGLVHIQDQGPFRIYRVKGSTPSPQ